MKPNIKYTNRDYDAIMSALVDNIKYYYPESLNDFSPASPAMIMLQSIAYVGDVLNFYIDNQVKQSMLNFANQKKSIYNIAQSYGYKIKTSIPASVELTFEYIVPKLDGFNEPDLTFAPILEPGTVVNSSINPNSTFTVLGSVNFKDSNNSEYLPVIKEDSGNNQFYIIRKKAEAYSVRLLQHVVTLDKTVKNNTKIMIPNINVVKIESVYDSNGNEWYQVDNLSNDMVISKNSYYKNGATVLSKTRTNKRFRKLVDQNDNTYLYFGSQISSNKLQSQLYSNFRNFDKTNIQPTLLVLNSNYGQVPYDTVLTIRYYVSSDVVAKSMDLDTIVQVRYGVQYQTPPADFDTYKSSLLVYNTSPSIGGLGVQPIQQIRQNTYALISSQQRLVTLQDYSNMLQLLPSEYGVVGKSYFTRNSRSNIIQLYILSLNNIGKLTYTNLQNKKNIGQFLENYRMIGDIIQILDAKIINVRCKFTVAVSKNYNKQEVLYRSILKLKQIFAISLFDIGTPIQKYKISSALMGVQGVSNVVSIDLICMHDQTGLEYSNVYYDMNSALQDGVYYTAQYPSIFQIKYPDKDIIGSAI